MKPLSETEQVIWDAALYGARQGFEADGSAVPMLLALHPTLKQIGIAPMDGCSKSETSHLVNQIKATTPCVLVVEAWRTRYHKDTDSAVARAVMSGNDALLMPPRSDLNREEVVFVQLFHKERHVVAGALITRPAQGPPKLADWEFMDNEDDGAVMRPISFDDGNGKLASGDVR